ncbi:glucuronyl hydrolase [Chitinophaga sp. RAB17]|uniref:glucuronyl hydrolase n=1 Tax=Chitinophaga sp. RAB17 TaxID=3233049 RepID=UPI003F8D9B4B
MITRPGVITAAIFLFLSGTSIATPSQDGSDWFKKTIHTINYQLTKAAGIYSPGMNPRSVRPDGTVKLATVQDWTTGFFPGSLWYGYELTGNTALKEEARKFTLGLDTVRHITNTHDLGFMLFCSYGNAFRITGDSSLLPVLQEGAAHLYARFNKKTGTIRSWDMGEWHYPVIIDNMMNLEYLFWAAGQFHQPAYSIAPATHAATTMKNQFRKDFSSYHVVDYDAETGKVFQKVTHQGLTSESAWARGQAWGLYGYVMCYQYTRNPKFLEQAKHIASFIMHHPHMPKDKIPAWDFDVHNALDGAPRDASAAAVIASALLQLSTEVAGGQEYFNYAEDILQSLSSPTYLAGPGENHFFLLKHSVGAFLYNSEIDTPIEYADYYFLEALKRYGQIKKLI